MKPCARRSTLRISLALLLCAALLLMPHIFVVSEAAQGQRVTRRAPPPCPGKPEGTFPNLDEVRSESRNEREPLAPIPSTMPSPKLSLEPWNGRRVGDPFPEGSGQIRRAESTMTSRILIVVMALTAFGIKVDAVGWQDSGRYARFDIYDSKRDAIETRIILDNLAKQLNMDPTLRGYLIAYAGKEACRNEAKSRLLEAKRYLKEKHNIDSPQVSFADGGFQTNWVVQIWIGVRQHKPPEKEPALSKNQVKFIKNCNLVKL